jgi:peptidoglycan/LPS O-acetylase OafA/YrhL
MSAVRQMRRNVGLDVLRCCAILPVVVYHMGLPWAPLEQWGFIGVEVFFALSGFLIAQMIAERFDGIRTADALASFLVNRWMRTLPLYFLALLAYVWVTKTVVVGAGAGAISVAEFARLPALGPYLTLTQNVWTGGVEANGNWFSVSWTLALEEWFYVLLPLLLLAGQRCGWTFERMLVRVALVLIVGSIAARLSRHLQGNIADFDDLFRRAVLFRLDALCYGALAYVAMTRFAVEAAKYRAHLAAIGIVGLWLALAHHPVAGQTGLFAHVFYWAVAPASVCFVLPAFYHAEVRSAVVARAAQFVSTRTYALYLSHMLVAVGFAAYVADITPATALALLACDLVIADVVYRLIERPLLRLRPAPVGAMVLPWRGAWVAARPAMPA